MEHSPEIDLKQIRQIVDRLCRRYYWHSQPEDREDMVADVALIAVQKHQTNETIDARWMNRTAKNVVINASRRAATRINHRPPDCHIEERTLSPEAKVLLTERNSAILDAIHALPPIHRLLIRRFYYETLTSKTISDLSDCPQSTVTRQLVDARAQLAKRLSPILSETEGQSQQGGREK